MNKHLIVVSLLLLGLYACKSAPIIPPNPLPNGIDGRVPAQVWNLLMDSSSEQTLQSAVVGNNLYLADPKGRLMRVNSDGQVQWEIRTEGAISAGVGASSVVVAVATTDAYLRAFSAVDGKSLWQVPHSNELLGPPLVIGNRVLVRTADGLIIGYDAHSGARVWLQARPIGALAVRSHQPMLSVFDIVIAGGAQGQLFAFNPTNGQILWERTLSRAEGVSEVERLIDIVSPPVVDQATADPRNSRICAATFNGKTACVRASDGQIIWQANVNSAAGLAILDDTVIVIDRNDTLHGLALADGQSRWSNAQLLNRALSTPAVFNQRLIVGDGLGYVFAINPQNGAIQYFVPTLGAIREVSGMKQNPRFIAQAPVVFGARFLVQTRTGEISAWQ